MAVLAEQPVLNFYTYPPVGEDDWRYTFATARVRVLESQMLGRATFIDMANAENFAAAVELLAGGEYATPQSDKSFARMQDILLLRRSQVRDLFKELIIDQPIVELLRAREDFANMRLALRRKLTEKLLGTDYSNDGSIPADQFEEIFEQENYSPLPIYMQEAIEQAVLAYYQDKDIRRIDYALDSAQARYRLKRAKQLKSLFLLELFRMRIDLTNIRTMLRLKFAESDQRSVFLGGGYIELERLRHGLDVGYEALAPLFFAGPYYEVVEHGVNYLVSNNSFLRLEQQCDNHVAGYLKSTVQITAGPQPVIAYLLMKENEIRTVRFLLTAKKNQLDTRVILDCLGE